MQVYILHSVCIKVASTIDMFGTQGELCGHLVLIPNLIDNSIAIENDITRDRVNTTT